MTEEKFEAALERMGDTIERSIEGAADRLDKAANRAWNHRPVRLVCGAIRLLTGAGLIAGAVPLAGGGHHTAAKVCLAGGGLVIAFGVAESILFRKK